MPLEHYSTRGLQVTFKRTKLVKPDLLPDRLTMGWYVGRAGQGGQGNVQVGRVG